MCFAGVGAILPPAGNIAPFRFIPVPLYINGGALMSKPLTATQIRCLSAGKFIFGGITGLYLKKSSKTSGFFYLRFSDSTGRHEISLGLYPDLSLADARAAAAVARAAAAVARADLARGKAFTCTPDAHPRIPLVPGIREIRNAVRV